MKQKVCKVCKTQYKPVKTLQVVCGVYCGLLYAREQKQKSAKKELKERKVKLKTKGEWAKDAQHMVNRYVRARDRKEPCISCGKHHTGQYHAGHYLSVGAHPQIRYNLNNIWKQCSVCNNHLSGNQVKYRINLVKKIGLEAVEKLECNQSPRHYTIDDLKRIISIFRKKTHRVEKREGNEIMDTVARGFEHIWKMYPRERHNCKAKCLKAFEKHCKTKKFKAKADVGKYINLIGEDISTRIARASEMKFLPLTSTYFNSQRWMDGKE